MQVSVTEGLTAKKTKFWRRHGRDNHFATCRLQMIKFCRKMEAPIKLNFAMINLILTLLRTLSGNGGEKITFDFIKFSSIYLGWVSYFHFCKIVFFITGNAPLILKNFNSKADIILFLICELLFLSYGLLFTISLLVFLN